MKRLIKYTLFLTLISTPAFAAPIVEGIAVAAAWLTGAVGGSAAVYTAIDLTLQTFVVSAASVPLEYLATPIR